MGLIRTGYKAINDILKSQYLGVYSVDSMNMGVLAVRADKRRWNSKSKAKVEKSSTITNGSVIIVGEGQCVIITNQGKITEVCAEPGEFVYDKDGEPTLLYGEFDEEKTRFLLNSLIARLAYGNVSPREQMVYFINTKEITGNKYGTPNPIPFRLTSKELGREIYVTLRCFGEYSYKITDPLLFFANVCGNIEDTYTREMLEGQLKTELLSALQFALSELSSKEVWYSELTAHVPELTKAIIDEISEPWKEKRGISISTVGISSLSVSPDDMNLIRELQRDILL